MSAPASQFVRGRAFLLLIVFPGIADLVINAVSLPGESFSEAAEIGGDQSASLAHRGRPLAKSEKRYLISVRAFFPPMVAFDVADLCFEVVTPAGPHGDLPAHSSLSTSLSFFAAGEHQPLPRPSPPARLP